MKQVLTVFFLTFLALNVFAQEEVRGVCGVTERNPMLKESLSRYYKGDFDQTEALKYIPVVVHNVGNNDGEGYIYEKNIFQMIPGLNEYYKDTDFRFYLADNNVNYLNSNSVHTNPEGSFAQIKMKSQRTAFDYGINLFIAKKLGDVAIGTKLGYFTGYPNDWIVMKHSEINYSSNTLAHEVGHFFSLDHTFFGWESHPFRQEDFPNDWPIAPVNTPSFNQETELVDGSNATAAADLITDTPPDYNFGIIWNNCDYTGGAKDPNGVLVDPQEKNQMSYFNGCDQIFTPIQSDVMVANYGTVGREYLQNDYVPTLDPVVEEATLVSPIDGEAAGTSNVTLKWNTVDKASRYFIQISRTTDFSEFVNRYYTTETQFTIPDELTADVNYFWRVVPFNEAGNQSTLSTIMEKFTTHPVATSDIKEINAWTILPNPTTGAVNLTIQSDKALTISAQVISLDGRVLSIKEFRTATGQQNSQMPTIDTKGTFFLRLMSNNGVETRRIVVQ